MNLPKPTMRNMRIPAGITLGEPRGESQTMEPDEGYIDDLERSVRVLAYLVREEYPIKYSLADIAGLWGSTDVDDQDIAALRRVEQRLFPRQEEADS